MKAWGEDWEELEVLVLERVGGLKGAREQLVRASSVRSEEATAEEGRRIGCECRFVER